MNGRPAPAPRKKAAVKKPAAPKGFTAPKGPLAVLDEAAANYLSTMVMTHPGGCESGKVEFITRLGLPKPPPVAEITVVVKVPVVTGDFTNSQYDGKKVKGVKAKAMVAAAEAAVRESFGEKATVTFSGRKDANNNPVVQVRTPGDRY